jgi:putative transcriptional regulator
MAQILRSKNLATKFQILLEIAASQPNIQQRDIAKKLNITSQAVSEYVKELIADGWLSSQGRSRYKVTREGVDWILRMARQLQSYTSFVSKVVSDISISTAIADGDLSVGQAVSLYMKDGLLFASDISRDEGARGVAVSEAKKDEDVGISNVEGVIKLKTGKVTIAEVPNVQEGGSKNTDLVELKQEVDKAKLVGFIGMESLAALKQLGIKPDYAYGVKEAAVEAAYRGSPFLVICAEAAVPSLVQRLQEENLDYKIVALRKDKKSPHK